MPGSPSGAVEKRQMISSSLAILRGVLATREVGVIAALFLLFLFFAILRPRAFLRFENLLNVARQVSLLGIMGIGVTFVLVSREIDLSVESIYALGGVVCAMLVTSGMGILTSIIFTVLIVGFGFGLINGLLCTYGKIPSLVVTLGMLSAARGVGLVISEGKIIFTSPRTVADIHLSDFLFLGQGKLFDFIPMQFITFFILLLFGWVVLRFTTWGFHTYATGGNERAARVSGIKVFRIKILAFVLSGVLASWAGILNLSFLGVVQGTAGTGLSLDVIAAVIIGGASLSGGEGTMWGTLIGVFIMGILRNGLVILGMNPFWQTIAIGVVIIIAVAIDMWIRRAREV